MNLSDYFVLPVGRIYDISPDGRRFLVIRSADEEPSAQMNVVLNWFEELKRLAPVN